MGKQVIGYRIAPLLASSLALVSQSAWAEETVRPNHLPDFSIVQGARYLAQAIQVIEIQVNPIDVGVEVILKTADGALEISGTSVVGNALIAEIPNAVLANDEAFQAVDPAEGISLVSVEPTADDLRVTITGVDAPPTADVRIEDQDLVLSVTPDKGGATGDDSLRLLVTGEQERDYIATQATVGTRTVTPILEVPQSIQVVPETALDDQNIVTLNDALRNVSGVQYSFAPERALSTAVIIRGFNAGFNNILVNGVRDTTVRDFGVNATNIERVEVLKGPASVLYGLGDLGGTINVVTEQPLSDPFYELEYTLGSFNFNRPAIDLSGPLNASGTLLYRLNAAVEFDNSFVESEEIDSRPFVAPVLTWQINDDTSFTLEASYLRNNISGAAPFLPASGTVIDNPEGELPLDVNLGEPDLMELEEQVTRVGYRFEHQLSEDWEIRSEFNSAFLRDLTNTTVFPLALLDDQRTLIRAFVDRDLDRDSYTFNNSVIGDFSTGPMDHQLVAGIELARETVTDRLFANDIAPIDIFDPVFSPDSVGDVIFGQETFTRSDSIGFYLQDQIALTDDLILALGGRFDIAGVKTKDKIAQTDEFQQDEAFSPRIGLVYQLTEDISLYTSFARSFTPQAGQTFEGDTFDPERGTQYEVGVKANLLGDQLFGTLAFFNLTRTNVLTTDPDNTLFQIQTGKQRSRGLELDVQGEILPGWNIIASYALTDAEITEDEVFEEGNALFNVPRHSGSLWTVYELQRGPLEGLGVGMGLFFVGDREGDLANSFELPSYTRTDALVYYQRGRVRAQVNLQNLFDINLFEASGGGNDLEIVGGEPFTVSAKVSFQF